MNNEIKQQLHKILDERKFNLKNFDNDYIIAIDNYNFEYNCNNAESKKDFIDYCLENWQ